MAQAVPIAGLAPGLEQTARQIAQLRQTLTGIMPPDLLAWIFNTTTNVVIKSQKYGRGDMFRQLAQTLAPVYRAEKRRQGVSGLEAYSLYYKIVAEPLRRAASAYSIVGILQQVQGTPGVGGR